MLRRLIFDELGLPLLMAATANCCASGGRSRFPSEHFGDSYVFGGSCTKV